MNEAGSNASRQDRPNNAGKRATGFVGAAAALLFVAGMAGNARAADDQYFDAKTKTAMQDVIKGQLAAFDHNDAKAAESYAAPDITDRFPEPDKFFDMVKEKYAALIHAKSTTFGETTPSPHGPLQKMTVVAADGTVWTAIYAFKKVDGNWRILGCGLMKDPGQEAI